MSILESRENTGPSGMSFALVTGSSRGIGRAVALALAERGMNIAVHYHTRADAAEEVLTEVRARGADGFTLGRVCKG